MHHQIRSGKTFQNGKKINPGTIRYTPNYEIISIITSGNVEASRIGGDRSLSNQYWKGNISEVIIFNKQLGDSEVIGIVLGNKFILIKKKVKL